MLKGKIRILVVVVIFCSSECLAQDYYNFVQFYVNPSNINPSLTGIDGRSALFLSYKNQWSGLSGAPRISNVNFQTALPNRVNLGLNINSDKKGLLNTSSLFFTTGYTLPVANAYFVRFGLSFGAAWNVVDMDQLNFGGTPDPVQGSVLDNSFQTLGNVGISFHSEQFQFGISVPNIFEPAYLSTNGFNITPVNPFETILVHANYRMFFANNLHVFEPYVIYRYHQSKQPQLEAAGVLHLNNVIWLGGSYKQDFGISGVGGIKLNKVMSIGYSYTLKNTGANEISFPSHEVSIGLLFGKKSKDVPAYSFVNTEREKRNRSYRELLSRQKRKEQELKRKYERDKARQDAEKARAEQARQEQARQEQARQEQARQEQARQEQARQEQARQEQARQEQERQAGNQVTTTTEAARDSASSRPLQHTAGPRFRQSNDPLANNAQDQQWHDENDRLNRLEQHADDPDEHHNETGHANAERHEFYKRGGHRAEMDMADYVIAGVFRDESNAKRFSDGLRELGFVDTDYGHISETGLWYVHISESNNINKARTDRDQFRKMKMFKDAWLLTVQP